MPLCLPPGVNYLQKYILIHIHIPHSQFNRIKLIPIQYIVRTYQYRKALYPWVPGLTATDHYWPHWPLQHGLYDHRGGGSGDPLLPRPSALSADPDPASQADTLVRALQEEEGWGQYRLASRLRLREAIRAEVRSVVS